MKIKKFKQFLQEAKTFKFSDDQFDSINKMYVGGSDDEQIIKWISTNIKSKLDPKDIYQQFISQKSGKWN